MTDFPPPRRGLMLLTSLVVVFFIMAIVFTMLASREPIGLIFTIYTLIAAITFIPLPILAYRLYSLNRANYGLDRNKLTLSWGLREEAIPISEIEWVRQVASLAVPLRLPFLHLPGAITGLRKHPDYGQVEFLASDSSSLLLVATSRQVFGISPQDVTGFMQNIQHAIELGSLSPAVSQSVRPAFIVALAWESLMVRYLWLAGLFLNVGLLAWVSLMIPSLGRVALGFLPSGSPREPVPGAGLILLPVVSVFFYLAGWVTGLVFYRRTGQRMLAKIVWAGGILSTVLFLVAVMFIVTTPA